VRGRLERGSAFQAETRQLRVDLLGCAIDPVDMDTAVATIDAAIAGGSFCRHADVNASKIVALQTDAAMRASIENAELVVADGQSVVWASRLLGQPLPARVAGIDLMNRLIELAEHRGYSIYILGARQEILEHAVERLHEAHPALRIAGYRNGYFLARHGPDLGIPYVMGVGGSIDVVSGHVRRAPLWIQRGGFEWAFRLAQEPRRLFRRYLVTNAQFLALVFRHLIRRRRTA
jgi:N-acetylglucosaminyldiphosphoundecaprenol N-acetyl-beta-D-mannosaminyltransferase